MARLLWTQKQHVGPRPRFHHAMAFDSRHQRAVLFGGATADPSDLGDTWTWDGENWTQVDDIGPRPRSDMAMAYDPGRDRTVLFGGGAGTALLGDTWEWNGEDWTQMADSGPVARVGHCMVFDAARNRALLFGGDGGAGLLNDTWQWDGSEWVQVEDTGPSVRRGHAMTFDIARGRAVLFGGFSGSAALGDTWEWDGTAWTQTSDFGPPACLGATMVHSGRRALVFGGVSGLTGTPQVFGLTWEWDGRHWTVRQDMGPGLRWGHAMVFDSARIRGVLFGGTATPPGQTPVVVLGDTYEQFEPGLAVTPPPPGPGAEVQVVSVGLATAEPIEGQAVAFRATLSGTAATGTRVSFRVEDGGGVVLSDEISVDAAGSATVASPSMILAAGLYRARATLGTSQQSAAFEVGTGAVSLASLIGNPAEVPVGTPLTLSATLTGPAPAAGITVPLRVGLAGNPGTIWLGPQLAIGAGQTTGSIEIGAQILDGIQRPAPLTWTGTLGGVTHSADVTLT